MTETATYIQRLLESNPLREPTLRLAIQTLHLPQGSIGLDAGCGIGLQALLLAEEIGPAGHVRVSTAMPARLGGFYIESARLLCLLYLQDVPG